MLKQWLKNYTDCLQSFVLAVHCYVQAPSGCFQLYNDFSAVISSFNYDGGEYLREQHYR